MRPTTLPPKRSRTASISTSSGSRSSIRSSPSRTAKGSSPTCPAAHSTAWPSPRGACWRTECTSASSADARMRPSRVVSPLRSRAASSSASRSKWSSTAFLVRLVTRSTSRRPAREASSTTYSMAGRSTTGSISLGRDLVAGRNLVPRPAAGITAFFTDMGETLAARRRGRWFPSRPQRFPPAASLQLP